uniref:FAD/NAD(P)-binding domain-containing protein n=1 Tax=Fusarium oxysporum (strain Fo5176) TaxID=660025 RepID=A0A0C4DIR5_FUSOF
MSIQRWQQEIKLAKSIVIAGAGQTGSEVAGELGEEYASKGLKEITLVVKDDLPLSPPVRDNVRRAVKSSLEKLKVHVIRASQVTSVCQSGVGGGKILEITNQNGNKMTVEVDVYIPAFGTVPNSHFAPAHMLDASKRFKQTLDLRADGYENIFVIGDVGNLQTPNAKHVDDQVIQLSKILPAYLTGLELPKYVPDNSVVFAVSLGKGGGTGQLKSVKLFSLAVWLLKSRYLGTNYANTNLSKAPSEAECCGPRETAAEDFLQEDIVESKELSYDLCLPLTSPLAKVLMLVSPTLGDLNNVTIRKIKASVGTVNIWADKPTTTTLPPSFTALKAACKVEPVPTNPFKKSECEARHSESAESDYANSYARLRTCLDRNGMIGRRQSVRRHGRLRRRRYPTEQGDVESNVGDDASNFVAEGNGLLDWARGRKCLRVASPLRNYLTGMPSSFGIE